MDIKDEFTFVIEWLKPYRATALHMSATNASPFKSLIENSKANKGSFWLFRAWFFQYIVSFLMTSLQIVIEVPDMVCIANDALHCLDNFNVQLRAMYDLNLQST